MSQSNRNSKTGTRSYELATRLAWVAGILIVYCILRTIPLTFVNVAATSLGQADIQTLLVSMLSGDQGQYSVMALGIMPYMMGMVIIMFANAFRSQEARQHTSPRKMNRANYAVAFVLAIIMSINHLDELVFVSSDLPLSFMHAVAAIEMILGAVLIVILIEINKRHGIGQMTPIIMVNVIDSLITSLSGQSFIELRSPLLISSVAVVITLMMELVVVKIPVQRVSIHNNYAESNYIGFKLNPIGVMPVMFATLLFIIPQALVKWGSMLWPNNETLIFLENNLVYTEQLGVIVYLIIIFVSAIGFSFLLLSPGDMGENLQRGGDSIVGVHAGPRTVSFLRSRLFLLSALSGFVMVVIMALSFSLSLNGVMSVNLAMLPSSLMIFAGFVCTLGLEIIAYAKFDMYKAFL